MLKIPKEQMEVFEAASDESLIRSLMKQVRSSSYDHVPASDSELRESVIGWIGDARRWGFSTNSAITRYVDLCAQTQGQREGLETRLETYLRLYHEELLHGLELQKFVQNVIQFATQNKVHEEEGIAWLAVILLAGRARGDLDRRWIISILDQPTITEEDRVLQVHRQAISKGWIAPQKVP